MTHRSPVPVSPAFEAVAQGAQFRDVVAIVVHASPKVIFQALHEVTLRDMKLAWLLGELRYLPSRLAGQMPAVDSNRPFLTTLIEGGTLVLRDEAPCEVITGSAAQLHRVHQATRRFATREAFDAFDDPGHQKLFMSVRLAPTGRPGEHWLILEHATRALSSPGERKFARYWRVIKPLGAFVTWQLLRAVRRRAERATAGQSRFRLASRSVRASAHERLRTLPGDERIPTAIDTLTHAVTIRRPPRDVWPWLVQMGAGSRGGWYSYDWLDNRGHRSATRLVPELQHPAIGSIFPAMPGVMEGFTLLAIEPERVLTLAWPAPDGTPEVTWTFVLDEVAPGVTRLVVRARGGPGYRFHRLPLLLTRFAVRIVHFIMQRKQLLGIRRRAETALPYPSAFRTPEGRAAFLAAYDAAMKLWPVPYEELEIPGRFGMTHVIVSGPKEAPPLVLLHGYDATSTMWAPNVADFSEDSRVFALDVMGQPSKSTPTEPVRNAEDYAVWLADTLDGLHLDRICLVGQSYGGWLALNFAMAAPDRVQKLVLLSPGGGFVPMTRQFSLRGMLMVWLPTRATVNWFMRWLGFTDRPGSTDARPVLELMHLGLKHFRVPVETLRVMPVMFPDDQLRAMRVPTLLLIGDHEVICDAATALTRARRLFPDVQGELVSQSSHDMCFSQHRIVDARVRAFLKKSRPDRVGERSVA
jgi:pimeloyl-ACP methyl ester carboxylesterase